MQETEHSERERERERERDRKRVNIRSPSMHKIIFIAHNMMELLTELDDGVAE